MQTTYQEQRHEPLYPGQMVSSGSSYAAEDLTPTGLTAQVTTITFAAGAATVGDLVLTDEFGRKSTINGVADATNATTTATSAKDLLEADDIVNATVAIEQAAGVLTLTSLRAGEVFTLTELDDNATVDTPTPASPFATIPFGVFIADGGAKGKGKLPSAAGDAIKGIALRQRFLAQSETELPAYPKGGPIKTYSGRDEVVVLCDADADISHGDALYARHTAASDQQLGAARHNADTDEALITSYAAEGDQFSFIYGGNTYQAVVAKRFV